MSALTSDEQELFDVARASVPRFLFAKPGIQSEVFAAAAKAFGLTRTQIDSWLSMTLIGTAVSFWLDQHAIDRGTRRQNGETDEALAGRIRRVDDAVTIPALQGKINAILTADGVAGVGAIVELRRAAAHFGELFGRLRCLPKASIANGASFVVTDGGAGTTTFKYWTTGRSPVGGTIIDVRTAVTATDVADATITALIAAALPGFSIGAIGTADPETVYFEGVGGKVAKVSVDVTLVPGFLWTLPRGKNSIQRGVRIACYGSGPGGNEMIIILPFGTSAATAKAVSDDVRQFKGGGIRFQVEVRRIP